MLTGQMTLHQTANDVGSIVSETAVINPVTNQYLFRGSYPASGGNRYFAIDIATGTLVNDTIAPDAIRMLQIHPTTHVVYGLWYNSANTTHHLASVNMLTGQMTLLDTLNNVGSVVSETAVINPVTNQYLFRGTHTSPGTNRYFAIDIATGNLVSDTIAVGNVKMLQIHPTTNVVYGLWYNSNNSTHHLASVNMLTGHLTILDTANNVGSIVSETAVINPVTNQYLFRGSHLTSGGNRYLAMDIATKTLINDTLAPDNIRMLKYFTPLTSGIETRKNSANKIYPNPFNQYTTIDFENPKNEDCTFILYDIQGRIVKTITHIYADKIIIERNNLDAGLYFFQLRTESQIITTGKLTID